MSTPIVPTVTEDGIELFASDDFVGMSKSGLSRFVGVPWTSFRRFLSDLSHGHFEENVHLKSLSDMDFTPGQKSGGSAELIPAYACSKICAYFAIEKSNKTAIFSLTKFAGIGIETWIKQVTGYAAITPAESPEQITIRLLQERVGIEQELREKTEQLRITQERYNEKAQTLYKATINAPGLAAMIDHAAGMDEDHLLLPEKAGLESTFTLREWMASTKLLQLDGTMFNKFVSKVHGAYKAIRHKDPEKEYRPQLENPKKNKLVQVYTDRDFGILQQCYLKTIMECDK